MKLEKLYDDLMELQGELEDKVSQDNCNWYMEVKALAATYELQDYLAHLIEAKKE